MLFELADENYPRIDISNMSIVQMENLGLGKEIIDKIKLKRKKKNERPIKMFWINKDVL